jgi:branched-chain amino acid transport system substrate-binding protein
MVYPMKKTFIFLILILLLCSTACVKKDPIKIGFSGPLTGKFSDFGTSGRDGVAMAVEEINRHGGIRGRRVELLLSDDKNDAEAAFEGDKELVEEGVVAIIGHMTSSMSLAVADMMTQEKVILLSPTTSTSALEKKDDYFIRIVSTTAVETEDMARFVKSDLDINNIAFVMDESNLSYTESMYKSFKKQLGAMGGTVGERFLFHSGQINSFYGLSRRILDSKPDGVYIIANSQDSAMICQQIRKINKTIPLLLCSWAQTGDFVMYGGNAIEGVYFSHHFFPGQDDAVFNEFKKKFETRFNREPEFPAVYSYDCANVLFDALKEEKDVDKLKETIFKIKVFNGVGGSFEIDTYGDTRRNFTLLKVKNGEFIKIK